MNTRNRNTESDYKLERGVNQNLQQHNLYIHSSAGRPTSECMPSVCYTPSHMSRDALSNNSVDIESALYGIGSTNLVKPCEPVTPQIRNLELKDWFDRPKEVIMPYPLVLNNNERPFPV